MKNRSRTPMLRISRLRAVLYLVMFTLLVATAISWHVSPIAAGLLAVMAAFAVELVAPGDE